MSFSRHREPEWFVEQEHPAPALKMMALGSYSMTSGQSEIDLAPMILGESKPFFDFLIVKSFLDGPFRCTAPEKGASAKPLKFTRWVAFEDETTVRW